MFDYKKYVTCTCYERKNTVIPLKPRGREFSSSHFNRMECRFLDLVKNTRVSEIKEFLQNHSQNISVNCTDYTGQSALEIAVGLQDESLVEELLTLDGLSLTHLFGAILRAVQENQLPILTTLLEVYDRNYDSATPGDKWKLPGFGMTPIMVAASEGNLEITKFLLDKGHSIEKPHHPKCQCDERCKNKPLDGETLFESLSRMNAFRGLASPIYIMLANSDPFLAAFNLSKELYWMAGFFPEHKRQYQELSDQCSQFAADLLDQCQDTNEVKTILVQRKGFPDPRPRQYSRLQLAVQYRQKKFVAHPNCQQVLGAAWVNGLPDWWSWSRKRRALHIVMHGLLTPFAALAYILFPSSYILKPIRVPLNRFIYSVASYITFLALLITTVVDDTSREKQNKRQQGVEITVGIWVLGHIWELLMDMYLLGSDAFFKSWWLFYDLVMFSGFLIAEILFFLLVVLDIWNFRSAPTTRQFWSWYHPFLIAEGIFALCIILAFARLMLWYQIHSRLGPLGTSLRYMLGDVFRFFLIVCVFLCAFALGINSVYKNYKNSFRIYPNGTIRMQPTDFVSLPSTFKTLFWAGLGMASPDVAAVVVPGRNNHGQEYTEFLGYSMWALYHLVTVIILLNMLIAMMADSYVRVQRNADDEWKFARSSVLLAFFDKQSTLPPPFNMIPSIYAVTWLFKSVKQLCCKGNRRDWVLSCRCCYWESDSDREKQENYELIYQELIANLIRRYIQTKESDQRRQNGQIMSSTTVQRLRSQIFSDIRKSTAK